MFLCTQGSCTDNSGLNLCFVYTAIYRTSVWEMVLCLHPNTAFCNLCRDLHLLLRSSSFLCCLSIGTMFPKYFLLFTVNAKYFHSSALAMFTFMNLFSWNLWVVVDSTYWLWCLREHKTFRPWRNRPSINLKSHFTLQFAFQPTFTAPVHCWYSACWRRLLDIVQENTASKQESKVLASGWFILRNLSYALSKQR